MVQASQVNDILRTFYHFSGQRVNREKSQVFFSLNTSSDVANGIFSEIGFALVDNIGNYLGIPLFHTHVTSNAFEFVLKKVRSKLNGWEASKLSLAGRITLVK